MTWQRVKLRGLCSKIGSGATPHGGAAVYIDTGTSLIRSQNVYNIKFEYDGLAHITADAAKKLDGVTVEHGDVLLNITGDSVARTCIVPDNVLPARVNQHVAIIRANPEILDYRYLNYYLASPFMQAHMLGLAVGKGASRNAITKAMIEDFEIPLPPLPVQRRIADILSAYDDLIENNRKQIKLLEEAAQRLYKEWFIDLRFPGYEHTPIINGIPAGWSRSPISTIAEYLNGYAFKPSDWQQRGYPIIKIKEMNQGVSDDTPRNDGKDIPPKYLVKTGDILFSWSATLAVVIWSQESGWLNQHLFKVTPHDGFCREFVFQAIANTINEFQNLTTGATMKHIQRGKLDEVFVNVPDVATMDSFSRCTEPMRDKILVLAKQAQRVKETRDRLLPKLMSGEMDLAAAKM